MDSTGRGLVDERALDLLDFGAVRAMLARHTMTDIGAARAHALVPESDLERVREEQSVTSEMRALIADDGFGLPRVREIGDAVARAARGSTLGPAELREIGVAIAAADAAVRRVRAANAPVTIARCTAAVPLPHVAAPIDRAIGERGEVLDRASPALARIRRGIAQANDDARDRVQAILRSAQYAKAIQEPLVTVREGRFVIPIKAEFGGALQGVVHDTSSTGQTLFVEPLGALEANNRLRTLKIEEEHEIARILAELSALVGAHAGAIDTDLAILGMLDLALARAQLASLMRAVAPEIVPDARVLVHEGRHPLLGERAVPQSFALDDDVRIIVISGPNMGGKTVTLKLLGLFVVMAYCGMHLPAGEGTTIGAFSDVECDIGDEQSIAENASTFSAHLRRLRAILERANGGTLVLIDEIASGTEPSASAALATAILEHLLARGAHGIVTTHATELKLFAHRTAGVTNASVRFTPETYAPTYQLDVGSPGRSLAFPLARTLGLDPDIVSRAETLMSEGERDYDRALAELTDARAAAYAEREALQKERAHLDVLQQNARRRGEALERERRALVERADERIARALREFTAELERRSSERTGRVRVTPGQTALLGKVLADVHHDLGLRPPAPKAAPRTGVAVGDRVYVASLGVEAEIEADYGDTVLVTMGSLRSVVPKTQLALAEPAAAPRERSKRSSTGVATLDAAGSARTELDVRGKRFVEAEPLVEAWIDQAKMIGLSPLRLIHGKGTGLLGRGLQQHLKSLPGVSGVRYGQDNEGGSGVTVFEVS